MKERLSRIRSSIRTDFLIRFRRGSALATFAVMCLTGYVLIPDPSTGYSLMTIGGHRVVYSATAIALSSAGLYSMLLSLVGFYLISNSIRRDIQARTGFVIASTGIRNAEYLAGRFLGNLVFLLALCVGFLASVLVMFLLRGEAPFEVTLFFWCYLLLLVPAAIYTAVAALVFECVPFLSGKLGDVLYFFVWLGLLTAGAVTAIGGGAVDAGRLSLAAFLDPGGLAFLIEQLRGITSSDSFTVGHTPFDPSLEPILLPDLQLSGVHLLPRLTSALVPIPALMIALAFFHRFDPVRVRIAQARAGRGVLGRLNCWLKPLSRALSFGLEAAGKTSRFPLLRGVVADAWLSFASYPVLIPLALVCAVLMLVLPLPAMTSVVLPIAFLILIPIVGDVSCREKRFGTAVLLYGAPGLRNRRVAWKFMVAWLLLMVFVLAAFFRLTASAPMQAIGLLNGVLFFAAAATAFGFLSGNPKIFTVLALMFLYLVYSDHGRTPALNFAGWFGPVPAGILASYLGVAAAGLVVAALVLRWRHSR